MSLPLDDGFSLLNRSVFCNVKANVLGDTPFLTQHINASYIKIYIAKNKTKVSKYHSLVKILFHI